jgi:hypothetical protein
MNRVAVISVSFLIIIVAACPASSQTPYLQIYFDSDLSELCANCPNAPSGSVLDTLYIVAIGFDAYISAIEYSVDYTSNLVWFADFTTGLNIGDTPSGIATAWPTPQNAYSPFIVAEVLVIWLCDACIPPFNTALCPNAHPSTGYIRATTWPNLNYIYATNRAACICPTSCVVPSPCTCPDSPIPVETTTWGQIKAIYK